MKRLTNWITENQTAIATAIFLLIAMAFLFFWLRKKRRLKETRDKMDPLMFANVTSLIIDNLEGGYYDPSMWSDGRLAPNAAAQAIYADSGETMFGLDRKNGDHTSQPALHFWATIDNASPPKTKWKWNDKADGKGIAPNINSQLKALVVQIMQPVYEDYSSSYLSTDAIDLVEQDQRLLLHFIYAGWNGANFFKQWAEEINNAVSAGTTNLDALAAIALKQRTGSSYVIISQEGPKIASLFNQLKTAA